MAKNQHHTLCPLDGSARSEEVIGAIMPLVRACVSRVTILEVSDGRRKPLTPKDVHARLRDALRMHQIDVEFECRVGNPAREILEFARKSQVDLIAMTTHGRTGLARWFHGSVTEEVLRHADVPLLTCLPTLRRRDWKKILVPLDESVSVDELISDVSFLARRTGASVEVLQAALPMATVTVGTTEVWMQSYGTRPEAMTPLLKTVSHRLAAEGIDVHPARRWILSSSGILDRVREGDVDLLCMTTHGRRGLARFFMGSTAEEVLRASPCPVFIRRSAPHAHAPPTDHPLETLTTKGTTGEENPGSPTTQDA